jgi:hypothetical protein
MEVKKKKKHHQSYLKEIYYTHLSPHVKCPDLADALWLSGTTSLVLWIYPEQKEMIFDIASYTMMIVLEPRKF